MNQDICYSSYSSDSKQLRDNADDLDFDVTADRSWVDHSLDHVSCDIKVTRIGSNQWSAGGRSSVMSKSNSSALSLGGFGWLLYRYTIPFPLRLFIDVLGYFVIPVFVFRLVFQIVSGTLLTQILNRIFKFS